MGRGPQLLVEKVSLASKVHGDSGCFGRGDNLCVTHRTTWLNHGLHTGINQNL
jgi:hypothetical protein